jgi:hypothetical protein
MTALPAKAIVYVGQTHERAVQLRRSLNKRHGPKCAGQWSIVYGKKWRGWAEGTAIRTERPFVDLTTVQMRH